MTCVSPPPRLPFREKTPGHFSCSTAMFARSSSYCYYYYYYYCYYSHYWLMYVCIHKYPSLSIYIYIQMTIYYTYIIHMYISALIVAIVIVIMRYTLFVIFLIIFCASSPEPDGLIGSPDAPEADTPGQVSSAIHTHEASYIYIYIYTNIRKQYIHLLLAPCRPGRPAPSTRRPRSSRAPRRRT